MRLTVKHVERQWVNVPFRPVAARNMVREVPHWTIFELCQVTLDCGVVGIGETMVFYTWGTVTDENVARVLGRPATELMWDDSLGAGLQMALFDAVAKANDIPVHQLLGHQVRDDVSFSWWSIDMPAEDWVRECQTALTEGYISFKTKARPWWDVEAQVAAVAAAVPPHFDIDLDFNAMGCDSAHAVSILKRLERCPNVKIFESPIPQRDIAGNKYLRSQTSVPIAMHVNQPPLMTALLEDVCDGFVMSGGANQIMHESRVIAEANKVFWLQLVGTGLTAAWSIHLSAVCSHARWPAISCHNLYLHPLVKSLGSMRNGCLPVPTAPGLGVEVDWDAVEKYRMDPIPKPYPHPGLLIRVNWPSGEQDHYAHGLQYWHDFMTARKPIFSPGVSMEIIPDDGSSEWQRLRAACLSKPEWDMRPN